MSNLIKRQERMKRVCNRFKTIVREMGFRTQFSRGKMLIARKTDYDTSLIEMGDSPYVAFTVLPGCETRFECYKHPMAAFSRTGTVYAHTLSKFERMDDDEFLMWAKRVLMELELRGDL